MELATRESGDGMYVCIVELSNSTEYVYATSVSPDGVFLACVLGDGSLLIYNARTLHLIQQIGAGKPYNDFPCTSVRWLPNAEKGYILVSVSSAGGVFLWHWENDVIERINKANEKGNEISCLTVNADGDSFLTAGSDRLVRLYDSEGNLKSTLHKGFGEDGLSRTTHTNRIFSLHYVTPTMLVSAGWGSPIQVWDMRSMESRQQIAGAQIDADGVEPIPDSTFILTTSKRAERQLQVFNCVTGTELEDESDRISRQLKEAVPLMSRYSKRDGLIWTITSKPYKIIVISFSSGNVVASFNSPVTLMNLELSNHFPRQAFVSGAHGKILVARLNR